MKCREIKRHDEWLRYKGQLMSNLNFERH